MRLSSLLRENSTVISMPGEFEEMHSVKEKYLEAIRAFDAVIKERPNDFTAHFHLGIYCYRLGDFKRSVHHYEIADRLSPNHPTIQSDLPAARERLRDVNLR